MQAVLAPRGDVRTYLTHFVVVGPGVEKIAAQWAERNEVHQVVCKPDWNRHGRAPPLRGPFCYLRSRATT